MNSSAEVTEMRKLRWVGQWKEKEDAEEEYFVKNFIRTVTFPNAYRDSYACFHFSYEIRAQRCYVHILIVM